MLVDGEDAGGTGAEHADLGAWLEAHFVEPVDEFCAAIDFEHAGRSSVVAPNIVRRGPDDDMAVLDIDGEPSLSRQTARAGSVERYREGPVFGDAELASAKNER